MMPFRRVLGGRSSSMGGASVGFLGPMSRSQQLREEVIRRMLLGTAFGAGDSMYEVYGGPLKWPGAELAGADLSRLNMGYPTDLSHADLRRAILEGANFNDADLSYANLTSARARGLFLSCANLTGANFTDADLRGANLNNVLLGGAIFVRTDLRGARGFYQRDGGPPAVFRDCLGEEYVLQQLSNR